MADIIDVSLLNLIQGADAEWKTLGEIAEKIYSGGTPKTEKLEYWGNGTIPWMSSGEVNLETIYQTEKFITQEGFDNSSAKFVPANSVVVALAGQGKTRGKVARTRIKLTTNQSLASITFNSEKVSCDYVYHYLKSKYQNLRDISSGDGTRGGLNLKMISSYKIPIPSLEIQQKVVKILDKMTDYVTELTAELTLRQKQYSYYRDKLLTFPSQSDSDESLSVRWLKMGEFGEFIRGNGMQKKDFVESGFPAIHYGQIYTKYGLTADETFTFVTDELASKLKIADKNDLIIATTSENVEDILKPLAWLGGKVAIGGHESLFRHNENVKYLAYYFQTTEFQQMKQKYIVGTKVKDISKENLSNLTVPIPPLTEQKRIVEILDKFDKLTSDLTDGLPHEIELRQKQYEYWREQLLSFKKE